MTDLPREVTAEYIAQLLHEIDKAAQRLGYQGRRDVLEIEAISQATGIEPRRVYELLGGAEPQLPPRGSKARETFYRKMVGQRLDMLRKRAADPASPNGDSYRDIGSEVDLSYTLVGHLVNGERSARVEYSSPLEEHYEVDHGFLSKPEGTALAERLAKLRDGLKAGAVYKGLQTLGGEQAALRHTGEEVPSLDTLLDVVDALVAEHRSRQRKDASPAGQDRD
ncbi:hypothetical protein [Streptomyces sp. NPDC005525]|uniref:hypothetical protein n=1 Tax=Streptomyces sp. NPDC005525 TaxID=3364720 RepID=UPI00369BBA0C